MHVKLDCCMLSAKHESVFLGYAVLGLLLYKAEQLVA